MIFESYPWKQDLIRRKSLIYKYNSFEQFNQNSDAAYTVVEKVIFYSAFIIRKLIDCKGKLSDAAENYTLQVKVKKPLKQIDLMHRWPEEDNYDWENDKIMIVKGRDICNWLIHSYVFFVVEDDSVPISHFCVSSDFDRNKFLYMISLSDWIGYMDFVSKDSIVCAESHYDDSKKEYIYIKKERGN